MAYNVQRIWTWDSTYKGFYFTNAAVAGITIASNRCRCTLDGRTATTSAAASADFLGFSYMAFANTVVTAYAGAAGTDCRLFEIGSYFIYADKIDATTFTLKIHKASDDSLIVAGTTAFTFGTQYDWVICRDTTSVRLYWDDMDTPEAEGAQFGSVDSFKFNTSNVDASAYVEVGAGCFVEANVVGIHRPDPSTFVGGALLVNSSTSPHYDDYTHDAAGTPVTGAKHTHVDDISVPDDETTFLENPSTASTTFRQTFHTSSPTISNCKAVETHHRAKATVGSKDLDTFVIFSNGSTITEQGYGTVVLTTYINNAGVMEIPPGGSSQGWSQTDLDNLQIGVRWDVPADAVTLRLTSIFAEALGFDFNPEPTSAAEPGRHLLVAQVI